MSKKNADFLESMRVGANSESIEEEKKEPVSNSRPEIMIVNAQEESKSSQ